jgi:hypothetical protein
MQIAYTLSTFGFIEMHICPYDPKREKPYRA